MARRSNIPVDQKVSPNAAKKLIEKEKVLDLRAAGKSYRKIGKELGFSYDKAHRLGQEAFEELKEIVHEKADDLRELELVRLDALQAALWDKKDDPRHASVILDIMDSRDKLMGIYAPTKQEVTGPAGGPLDINISFVASSNTQKAEPVSPQNAGALETIIQQLPR